MEQMRYGTTISLCHTNSRHDHKGKWHPITSRLDQHQATNLEVRQVAILKFQQRSEGSCELSEWVFSLFCGRNFDVNTT